MITETTDFHSIAEQISQLSKFQDLFESCGKLMADTLIDEGKLFSTGTEITSAPAQLFSDLLASSPEELRPPFPAMFLNANAVGLQRLQALGAEGDFLILFQGPSSNQPLDPWLEACLNTGITSVVIRPDIDQIQSTDKALEIRLEYRSITDYLTKISVLCTFLTNYIEMQLFGRQA